MKYGPIEPGFKEYLTLMNQCTTKAAGSRLAATSSDTNFYSEYLTTGRAGSIVETYQDIVPLYNSLFTEGEGEIVAVPYPVLNEGDEIHLGSNSPIVESGDGRRDYLTTAVSEDRLEAVCRWRDNWYTEESTMLFNYGIEGRSYNMSMESPSLPTDCRQPRWPGLRRGLLEVQAVLRALHLQRLCHARAPGRGQLGFYQHLALQQRPRRGDAPQPLSPRM